MNHANRTVDAICKKCGSLFEMEEARWWRLTSAGNADTARCPKCQETLTAVAPAEDELRGITKARLAGMLAVAANAGAVGVLQDSWAPESCVRCAMDVNAKRGLSDDDKAIAAEVMRREGIAK